MMGNCQPKLRKNFKEKGRGTKRKEKVCISAYFPFFSGYVPEGQRGRREREGVESGYSTQNREGTSRRQEKEREEKEVPKEFGVEESQVWRPQAHTPPVCPRALASLETHTAPHRECLDEMSHFKFVLMVFQS